MLERSSVLTGVRNEGGRDGRDGRRRVRFGETRNCKLVQLTAFPTAGSELEQAVRAKIALKLPADVGKAESVGDRLMFKTGPDQFWIRTQDSDDLEPALQAAVAPRIGSVTALLDSRTCIWIDGSHSREVLATGLPIDLDFRVFGVNYFALTGLHHTPVLVHRTSARRFDLYVLRTYAVWTWEWLMDAALPYGYDVDLPKASKPLARQSLSGVTIES